MDLPQQINDFWLNEIGEKGWYERSDKVDQTCRDRFLNIWEQAADLTPDWEHTAEGALAALILTDQLPRNMFRDDPRAFATDPLARDIAKRAITRGFDMATPEPQRQFFYMPLEHSEELADQNDAVALFAERMPGESQRHAQLHRDTIARFGRFPWRNTVLGRKPTPGEDALMAAGGYGALVRKDIDLDGLPD